ncbi:MAG: AI-2E family transporter [Sinomonas sp.]|nr:AI-2E family transporter [Sinomonas sp.]
MPEPTNPPTKTAPADLWSDGLGRAATRSLQVLAVAAVIWCAGWALTRVPLVLIPVMIAAILASAISPLVRWLDERGWPRPVAVLASFVAILAAFGGLVAICVALVRAQSHELAAHFTNGIRQLQDLVSNGPIRIGDAQLATMRDSLQHFLSSGSFGTEALTGVRSVGEFVASMVLMAVILFFFLKDGSEIREFLLRLVPGTRRATARTAAERSAVVLGAYVRGTALVAAADALIVGIALLIIQVPLALPLAVFVFIGGFIPILGATTAGLLAVGVALLSNGPVAAIVVLIVVLAANQIEHHLLQPLLMGKVLAIHGLTILLALAVGTFLAGIFGALLAVPLTAVGWTAVKTFTTSESSEEPAVPEGQSTAP